MCDVDWTDVCYMPFYVTRLMWILGNSVRGNSEKMLASVALQAVSVFSASSNLAHGPWVWHLENENLNTENMNIVVRGRRNLILN